MAEHHDRAPRFRLLSLFAAPDPEALHADWDPALVFRVMFIADFRGEPDARPLVDRKPVTLDPRGFDATLALDYQRRTLGVKARSLAELRASNEASRESFHAADWLARSGSPMVVEVVNASAQDLLFELTDAPHFQSSWVRALFNDRNHAAMEPRHLLVLGFELDPEVDGALIEHLGLQAEQHAIPVLVPTSCSLEGPESEAVKAMRACSWARWLTFCAGNFRTPANTRASSALLIAQKAASILGATGGGLGLWGRMREGTLLGATPEQARLAWERGILAPTMREDGSAELLDDATFSSHAGTRRSLSWLLLVQRFTREARLIHFQYVGLTRAEGWSAERLAAFLESQLKKRFAAAKGLAFALEGASWEVAPTSTDYLGSDGCLRFDLRLSVDALEGEPITHVEPLLLHFSFG
jgi:hypothetical protein